MCGGDGGRNIPFSKKINKTKKKKCIGIFMTKIHTKLVLKGNVYTFRAGNSVKISLAPTGEGSTLKQIAPNGGPSSFLLEYTVLRRYVVHNPSSKHEVKHSLPCTKWRKIYQVYQVPLILVKPRKNTSL